MKTGNLEFNSSKLSYPSKELDLEILCTQDFLHTTFHVQSHTISPHQNNPKEALLTFIIEGISYSDIVPRHEGGQKVSLSNKMQEILISSLKKNLPVTVQLGSSETIIKAEKFAGYYNRLKRDL